MESVSQRSLSTLQGLPFDSLIGGPLNACVNAQANAAQTTINFIKEIGLQDVTDENGNTRTEAIYVYFSFIQNGRKVNISVPLLAIVPIPYIGINTIDINFKATVSGVESESKTKEFHKETTENTKSAGFSLFRPKVTTMKGSVSTKKDSKSTQDSKFSVEATIDVAVHASQDSMPAGMARILELLGSALDLVDPNGELTVSETLLYAKKNGTVDVVAQYKTPMGELHAKDIKCINSTNNKDIAEDSCKFNKKDETMTFSLGIGTYKISVGDDNYIDVEVKEEPTDATA